MKKMKSVITLFVFVALLLLGLSAQAQDPRYVLQDYTTGSALKRVFENVATNVTAYSTAIDVRKTRNITFMGNFKRTAAGTNTSIVFLASVDGSNWPTNINLAAGTAYCPLGTQNATPFVWQIPDTGTAADAAGVTCSTNFDVGGYGYIKVGGVAVPYDADQVFTNTWIKYSYKISAP